MRSFALLLFLAALAGCGDPAPDEPATPAASPAPSATPPAVFIALDRDFQGFRAWSSFPLGSTPATIGEKEGPRVLFVREMPAAGASAFPVGTMIVKEIQGSDGIQLFAMVKRGASYNYLGARDWEWFELTESAEGKVAIQWRGLTPPVDQGYGGPLSGGTCNDCHAVAKANDYVQSPPLQLAGRP